MKEAMRKVAEFCDKNRFPRGLSLRDMPADYDFCMEETGKRLIELGQMFERSYSKRQEDIRLLRIHLLLEELGELIQAMGDHDDTRAFDGLIDLLYVAIGAGVTFDYPLSEGFDEVAKSNMTKERSDPRLRDKGDNYIPPDLDKILKDHWFKKQ